jgi:uncharacterized membrane protein
VRSEPEVEFVPQASVAAGLTLGIVSFALLIYFLHHVSVFIRAPRIIDDVAHTLERTLRASFPERQGESRTPDEEGETEKREAGDSAPVAANATGYVQALDYDGLVGAAVEHEALIVLRFRPGQFVAEGRALADVAPPGALESTELGKKINEAFLLGPERTATQDPEFAVHQLVEIALRALSPGINDPHTAINCIDRLSAGLALLGTRELPSRYLRDEDDALRLVIVPLTYAGVVAAAFDPIREAAQGHLAVVVRMIDSLAMIGAGDLPDPYREALIEQLRALCRDSDTAGFADRDAEKLARACEAARDALTQPEHPS